MRRPDHDRPADPDVDALHERVAAVEAENLALVEQLTATSEILRVISSSPTDVQPVFGSIVASAARLASAEEIILLVRDGDVLRAPAGVGALWKSLSADFRLPLVRGSVAARSVIDGVTVHIHDLAAESEEEFSLGRDLQRRFGHRTSLAVPLLREGIAVGTIFASRFEVRPFGDQQIALLKTFADQAVIAIENVRLFEELRARNAELAESLEQQTATSEILGVINSSPTNIQPVLEVLAQRAVRLCDSFDAIIFRRDGETLRLAAHHGPIPYGVVGEFAIPLGRESVSGRSIIESRTVQVLDLQAETEDFPLGATTARQFGYRTTLAVPMRRGGVGIGAITVRRAEMRAFTERQVALLETFAAQAVIAIENVRLFDELQARTGELARSVEQLKALSEVGQAVSSTLHLETVLTEIVAHAVRLAGPVAGAIYEYDEVGEEFHSRATVNFEDEYVELLRAVPLRKGEGVLGRVAVTRRPEQTADITREGTYRSRFRDALLRYGYRALLAVPLLREDHIIGGLVINGKSPGEFPPQLIDLLQTFASQSALAIQNARLFRDLEAKSRQLEAASRHKSEFLSNMSHELRTPLNAIIGFSEVLAERMFGELTEKQEEYLQDIMESGRHLLSLINDILDLSKIEAGRMELELTDFSLPAALDSVLSLIRERAGRRGIAIHLTVDERLGQVRADERKIRQVVLNLLSNAIKFTPEGGRIEIRAVQADGVVEVSVTDTGIGIAPEDQGAVFEEFRQVGTAAAKTEGTGLGLALCRKFLELHGGKIWVTSTVGAGSTFSFSIPHLISRAR